jgi:hypothetical protein
LNIRRATLVCEPEFHRHAVQMDRISLVLTGGRVLAALGDSRRAVLQENNGRWSIELQAVTSLAVVPESDPAPTLAIPCGDGQVALHSEEFRDFTPSALAVAIFRFAEGRGYFEPLRQLFQPAVKTVAHTPQDKLLTLILSLMVGCPYTSGINRDLRPYPALAQLLGRPSLPDQSQVSRLLRGMTPWDLEDLLLVFEETLRRQSRSCSSSRPFTLDVDTSGLVADGRTYENTAKGYFPGARGKRGYQLDTAYVPDYAETLAVFLDRGNVPPGKRFLDVMCAVAEVLDGWERIGLVRGDCAQGTVEHMRFLLEHRLAFLLREKAWKAARRIGPLVPERLWDPVDPMLAATEGPGMHLSLDDGSRVGVRRVLSRCLGKQGWAYRSLCTTLSKQGARRLYPGEVVELYNQRAGSIEIDMNSPPA